MRVFSIGSDGEFTEYEQLPFKMDHEESVLEGLGEKAVWGSPLRLIG